MAIEQDRVEVIGGKDNFWLFSEAGGYDLTHPPKPDSPPIHPRLRLKTTTKPAMIDPKKTALVCVDLQNYFLSPLLGRPTDALGLKVVDNLLNVAIPACRNAGIPVLWLGWGLTREDIDGMLPTIVKGFAADFNFKGPRKTRELGTDIGKLKLEDGTEIEGGKILMIGQWNSEFYDPLKDKIDSSCDMFVSKNRLSGFWGGTNIGDVLSKRGITTLIFSGVNTDQCVGGSL